jgi:hypothetical protein
VSGIQSVGLFLLRAILFTSCILTIRLVWSLQSSIKLFNTSQSYAASQYASIYFTHDPASVTSDGQKYSKEVVQQCLNNPVQYVSSSECDNYGGIGYVIGYNFSALHVTVSFIIPTCFTPCNQCYSLSDSVFSPSAPLSIPR